MGYCYPDSVSRIDKAEVTAFVDGLPAARRVWLS
jgi:hypothetical protein